MGGIPTSWGSNSRVCEGGQNSEFPDISHCVILGVSGFSALGIGTFLGVSEFRTRRARVRMAAFSEFPNLLPLGRCRHARAVYELAHNLMWLDVA